MLDSATAFLNALTPDQKKQATYSLTDPERENWFFTPVPRQGLPLKQLNPQQRDLALALLRSGLSQRGLARAEAIMSMELVLKELEKDTPPGRRDPSNYLVTVFGPPDARKSWGWRFEGHHLSFNFTLVDGAQLFFAPSFIGSNPAEVRSGPRKGERVLGEEEDAGRALVKSLDAAQRKLAVLDGKAPGEIITSNKKRTAALTPAGLSATAMTATQRDQLLALIKLYASRQRPEISDATMAKVTVAGVDKLTFAWAGGFERGDPHYYRVQGPEFLIEFDNTQNDANHIHSVFRDFKGDFANDLLREHYANDHGK
ncbi:MAG: DUF3500 domain-containing protein [Opitutus sp.]|nr:DUF3500 domain-containing protein [Opitutus sp.]